MSLRSRGKAYTEIEGELVDILHNADELASVLRFFSAEDINECLLSDDIKDLIKDVDDLNLIMAKLFSDEQRKAVFKSMRNDIEAMNPSYGQLGELMQYLSLDKSKQLINSVSLTRLEHEEDDYTKLFEHMDAKRKKLITPVLLAKLSKVKCLNKTTGSLSELERCKKSHLKIKGNVRELKKSSNQDDFGSKIDLKS
jgi:hypothetical protein